MKTSSNLQENQSPSLIPSPNSHGTNISGSSKSGHSTPVTRSDPNNPYPTTFVQADTSSFKQVVQMLTGTSETAKLASCGSTRPDLVRNLIPPIKSVTKKDKASRLYERRNSLKNFKISTPLVPGGFENYLGSPRTPEVLSPSMLKFPALILSPVTPLILDPFNRCGSAHNVISTIDMEAENKAIAHKGFYLHPSPTTTPRSGSEPRLLPLFPVTSPRVSSEVRCNIVSVSTIHQLSSWHQCLQVVRHGFKLHTFIPGACCFLKVVIYI
ncbi:VQ motif-containing protein 4-like isoform X2 [Apium graveolens]|uniref:VQ motif-containing protein 4-like isoform X2 n=1 Tax=Apium graveolens TaxID=4045 RepID=UPI003D7B7402